jgi:hypothetical protein
MYKTLVGGRNLTAVEVDADWRMPSAWSRNGVLVVRKINEESFAAGEILYRSR